MFSWSYQHLDPDTARAFRLVGLHPGADLRGLRHRGAHRLAADPAAGLLAWLARAALLQPTRPEPYGLHDLLRAYALELATSEDGPDGTRAALTRLFDHYLHAAAKAMTVYAPAEGSRAAAACPGGQPGAADNHAACRTFVAGCRTPHPDRGRRAHRHERLAQSLHSLASVLYRYLDNGSHFAEAMTVYDHARRSACAAGDLTAEGRALYFLSTVEVRRSRLAPAEAYARQALARQREAGDRAGEPSSLLNLGIIELDRDCYEQASEYLGQSLAGARETGNQLGEAYALANLAIVDVRQGRYEAADAHLTQGLALARRIGSYSLETRALTELGIVCTRSDRFHQADEYLRQALAVSKECGDRTAECSALTYLGDLCLRRGQYQQARTHQRRCLALARNTGWASATIGALNGLGEVLVATGRPSQAGRQVSRRRAPPR